MGFTRDDDEWGRARKDVVNKKAKENMLRTTMGIPQLDGQYHMPSPPPLPQAAPAGPGWLQQGWPQAMGPPGGKGGGKGGYKGGKGGGRGDGARTTPLDAPQKSRCPMLKGPFAPEHERYDCKITCKFCTWAGVTPPPHHAGSWECDVQPGAPRSRFLRGEVDRWGAPAFLEIWQRPPLPPGPPPVRP